MKRDVIEKPSAAYHNLFKDDPLLLSEKRREKYAKLLLENVILFRSQKSYFSPEVDLFDESATSALHRNARADSATVSMEIKKAYRESWVKRSPIALSDEEKADLQHITMLSKGEKTSNRWNKFQFEGDAKSDDQNHALEPIKIAAIGHRVAISALESCGVLDEDLCLTPEIAGGAISFHDRRDEKCVLHKETEGIKLLGRTMARDFVRCESWLAEIEKKVGMALRRGANIIVLPEFSMPPEPHRCPGGVKGRLHDVCKQAKTSSAGPLQDFFMFSGSRHEGPYNRGLVYTNSTWPTDSMLTDTTPPQDIASEWHYKITSARSLGENILSSAVPDLPRYSFRLKLPGDRVPEYFSVFISICYDVFDPGVFMALAAQCAIAQYTPIVLVPSFNPSDDFIALLRDLSFLGRCIVIYVDGLHGESKLFVSGVSVSDLLVDKDKLFRDIGGRLSELSSEIQNKAGQRSAVSDNFDALVEEQRALEILDTRLKLGALDNVITVEKCPKCADDSSNEVHTCSMDVLYYNLDMPLVRALASLRYLNANKDQLLPAPLKISSLRRIAKEINDRTEQRKIRRT